MSTQTTARQDGRRSRRWCVAVPLLLLLLAGCSDAGRYANTVPTTTVPTTTVPTVVLQRSDAANYIPDGSFEHGLWIWQPYQSAIVRRVPRGAHRGRFDVSVRLAGTTAKPFGIWAPQVVANPVRGDRFSFSVWLRPAQVSVGHRITLELNESGGTREPLATAVKTFVFAPGWRRYAIVGTVHSRGRTSLAAFVFEQESIAAGDAFFVDDVRLVKARV
jgi:hypothetical protein